MVTVPLEEDFIARAAAVGAEIEIFPAAAAALEFVSCFLGQQDIKGLAVAPDVSLPQPIANGWPVLKPNKKEGYLAAGAGLVRADYGISDTGTLVHLDRNAEEKIVWTLPPVCLCLLDKRRLVRDLDSVADILSRHLSQATLETPQVSLVTGPSRTADIEGRLSLGVHGPSRLIILLHEGETS
jgi:L-lactate dehydrogenase complex protein LldG